MKLVYSENAVDDLIIGHPVPQAPDPESIRDMVFGDYVVRYAPREDIVIVLRIWQQYENR
jgi:hypothetical protein